MRQSQIASAKSELNYRESSNMKYNITYLLFLLGKAVLFSVVLTLLVNTYAYSVKPIYDMHNSSYLVSEVKALNAKDRMQPWIGILLIVALSGGYFMGGSYVDTLWGEVSGMWSDSGGAEQSDAGIEVVNDAVVEVESNPAPYGSVTARTAPCTPATSTATLTLGLSLGDQAEPLVAGWESAGGGVVGGVVGGADGIGACAAMRRHAPPLQALLAPEPAPAPTLASHRPFGDHLSFDCAPALASVN